MEDRPIDILQKYKIRKLTELDTWMANTAITIMKFNSCVSNNKHY